MHTAAASYSPSLALPPPHNRTNERTLVHCPSFDEIAFPAAAAAAPLPSPRPLACQSAAQMRKGAPPRPQPRSPPPPPLFVPSFVHFLVHSPPLSLSFSSLALPSLHLSTPLPSASSNSDACGGGETMTPTPPPSPRPERASEMISISKDFLRTDEQSRVSAAAGGRGMRMGIAEGDGRRAVCIQSWRENAALVDHSALAAHRNLSLA